MSSMRSRSRPPSAARRARVEQRRVGVAEMQAAVGARREAEDGGVQPPAWRRQRSCDGVQAMPGSEQAAPSGLRWQTRQPSLHSRQAASSPGFRAAWCGPGRARGRRGARWWRRAPRCSTRRSRSARVGSDLGSSDWPWLPVGAGVPGLSTRGTPAPQAARAVWRSRRPAAARRFRGFGRNPSNPAARAAARPRGRHWP